LIGAQGLACHKQSDSAEFHGMHRLLVMAENILDTATFFILNLQGLLDKYVGTEEQCGILGNRFAVIQCAHLHLRVVFYESQGSEVQESA